MGSNSTSGYGTAKKARFVTPMDMQDYSLSGNSNFYNNNVITTTSGDCASSFTLTSALSE